MALYRKYRPSSFSELVGQEQVTRPLSVALDSGRINHAYLFSGPRGCGKTSSARILARSLNCIEGPTSNPCGQCSSCVSLAPGGPGNLDVNELDAASNNGVADMLELRESAYYAPAESLYRIFIIDEAHMITNAGANALLKVVEEPPEHVIFIFATTEPEKVIGTIRSRTHHYPFRLLTPLAMRGLLERTAIAENIAVDDSVYPLIIRAGGGSPRDSLSILDQLIAGTGDQGLTYDLALPLLGVTDLSLIDASVDALASNDRAGLFNTVDDVIEAGHDPRRFVEDLLERLRDLMVLQAVPEALELGLVDAPTDRAEILKQEASQFTAAQLAHLATTANERVSDMRGATSPRLLLEILCAHLLLPTAPVQGVGGQPSGPQAAAVASPAQPPASTSASPEQQPRKVFERPSVRRAREEAAAVPVPAPAPTPEPAPIPAAEQTPVPAPAPKPEPEPVKVAEPPRAPEAAAPTSDDLVETLRTRWSQVRAQINKTNKIAGIMLAEARVLGLRDDTLILGHNTGALAERINEESKNRDIAQAVSEEAGRQLKVQCIVGTDPKAAGFSTPTPQQPAWNPQQQAAAPSRQENTEPAEEPESLAPTSEPEKQEEQTPASGWGAPRALGGSGSSAQQPAQQSQPPAATPLTQPVAQEPAPAKRPWEAAVERGRAKMAEREARPSFDSGVPLPPEPDEEFPPPPEETPVQRQQQQQQQQQPQSQPAPQSRPTPEISRREEEKMMVEEAQRPGTFDRRDASSIAMELLEQELGARKL